MKKTRVLLADDHPVLRLGVRELLSAEPDIEIIGEAGDGHEALGLVRELRPDVAVIDIAMPGLSGLEVTRRIRLLGLPCKVLIFTVHAHDRYLFHVLEAGGLGYVLKTGAYEELVEAVRTVARGEAYLRSDATRLLVADYLERAKSGEAKDSFDALSEREREVLTLTARGYTSQEIGEHLALSINTVQTYRRRLMEKLNLQHRAELVGYALRKGLLRADE
ncbi:MAG: response regulator transcription factor [Dehalococcoidales bacterium]|nr:response regulator transcription factor [Dehalococcoidales bacterium]